MSNNQRFTRGVFACEDCGRTTRGTRDSAACGLCGQCYRLSGDDNTHNDTGEAPTAKELTVYNGIAEEIIAKGGTPDIRQHFPYIFRHPAKCSTQKS